ncbi:MAG: hypothetical protein KGJ06_08235 [Pseudomonadota bacterium]|nr:hypothetical protein [Pseudomonadota bacterium]
MQELSSEERAKRGVIAALAYEILCQNRYPRNWVGTGNLINRLAAKSISIGRNMDETHYADPGLTSSNIIALTPATSDDRDAKIPNPFYSNKQDIELALSHMEEEGLVQQLEVQQGRKKYAPRYSLTQVGVEYFQAYEPELAKQVAERISTNRFGPQEIERSDQDTPWSELMPMAKKYAETICGKPEWER